MKYELTTYKNSFKCLSFQNISPRKENTQKNILNENVQKGILKVSFFDDVCFFHFQTQAIYNFDTLPVADDVLEVCYEKIKKFRFQIP